MSVAYQRDPARAFSRRGNPGGYLGFEIIEDPSEDDTGPNWPPRPSAIQAGLPWCGHDCDPETYGECHIARQHEEPHNQEGYGAHRLLSLSSRHHADPEQGSTRSARGTDTKLHSPPDSTKLAMVQSSQARYEYRWLYTLIVAQSLCCLSCPLVRVRKQIVIALLDISISLPLEHSVQDSMVVVQTECPLALPHPLVSTALLRCLIMACFLLHSRDDHSCESLGVAGWVNGSAWLTDMRGEGASSQVIRL